MDRKASYLHERIFYSDIGESGSHSEKLKFWSMNLGEELLDKIGRAHV